MTLLKTAAKTFIGDERRQRLRRLVNRVNHFGLARRCPCCSASLRRFEPFGLVPRHEAMCPVCESLERHRLIWLYVTRRTDLLDGRPRRMLHVAPEIQLAHLFQRQKHIGYLSADLTNPGAMVRMDITDIQYPDETFDVIYCSHVLEHVPEDRKAMREFFRVLKSGGWAILQVPIKGERTFEDPSVATPEERMRVFGQHDHVRRYGPDYRDRLVDAGFSVTVDDFARELDEHTVRRFGLMRSESIFLCRKAHRSTAAA
jgi:SAM-dependent methyltransferase